MLPAARTSSLFALVALAACAPGAESREARVVEALTRADESLLRTRPLLVTGKYRRMSGDAVAFMRGSLAITVRDWSDGRPVSTPSRFAVSSPRVPSLGDAHPENFGVLWSAGPDLALEAEPSFEPNDFDAADDLPYLVDLRRLAGTFAYALAEANVDDDSVRAAVLEARGSIIADLLRAYRETIAAIAAGRPPEPVDLTSPIVADLVRRATRDRGASATLTELTVRNGTERTLKRGPLDPAEPTQALVSLPEPFRARVDELVRSYEAELSIALPPGFLHVKDAVREFGSGVSSWPRVRLLLLLEGATTSPEDDVVLEAKELGDAAWPPAFPPLTKAATNRERVARSAHRAFSSASVEPLWQSANWLGLEWQLRRESAAQKNVRVARWVGPLGTPEALIGFGKLLGQRLARVHAGAATDRELDAVRAIDGAIGESTEDFVREEAAVAITTSSQLRDDLRHFRSARERFGPLLGFPVASDSLPAIDLRALVGVPPTP